MTWLHWAHIGVRLPAGICSALWTKLSSLVCSCAAVAFSPEVVLLLEIHPLPATVNWNGTKLSLQGENASNLNSLVHKCRNITNTFIDRNKLAIVRDVSSIQRICFTPYPWASLNDEFEHIFCETYVTVFKAVSGCLCMCMNALYGKRYFQKLQTKRCK